MVEEGYELLFGRRVITVFSARNYGNDFDNAGAVRAGDEGKIHRKKREGKRKDRCGASRSRLPVGRCIELVARGLIVASYAKNDARWLCEARPPDGEAGPSVAIAAKAGTQVAMRGPASRSGRA